MIHKIFIASISLTLLCVHLSGQVGEWTWMHGDSTMNYVGNYGTIGVQSPTNKPPGLYEASEWTDNQGNFWLYGGEGYFNSASRFWSDNLWKYDVATNQWTWIKGSGAIQNKKPVYGIQGVASLTNSPGERVESQSWKDNQGNLWLFGGISYYGINTGSRYNDLWKYSISTNMWTWTRGDTTYGGGPYSGHYGTIGIEDSLNNPGHEEERDITWTDNSNNLWMLDEKGCLWKYKIVTNNWIWMKGDTNGVTIYGQKGVAAANVTPGNNYFAYTRWKDSNDNFWFFFTGNSGYSYKSIFKYEINTNMWTWIWGDTILYSPISYYGDTLCDYAFNEPNENVIPFSRGEARACWIDNCNNLWLMGGFGGDHSTVGDFNDLIYFDTYLSKWIWVGNDTTHNYNSAFGSIGVSSPLNRPASRSGAIPFKDLSGNLWLYGGLNLNNYSFYSDLWKFGMDSTGCTPCTTPYHVGIAEWKLPTNDISIYPNPFSIQTTLQSNKNLEDVTLTIYNLLGQPVKKIKNISGQTIILHRDNLSSGLYFIRFTQDNKIVASNKLVIED